MAGKLPHDGLRRLASVHRGVDVSKPQSNWFVRNRVKTRQLVLLLNLYELRSVVHAAEATGISQPAASKLLNELEDALGVQLFRRHTRGVEPTWYAEVMVRHAHSALAELGRAQQEILALSSGYGGRATIGTVLNPGTHLLPDAIARLKARHPSITVSVDMDYSKALVARLLAGELDVVLGRIVEAQDTSQLRFEPLAEEPHVIIASARHPLTRQASVELADLLAFGWILPGPSSVLRGRIDHLLLSNDLPPPTNIVETFSFPVIKSLLVQTDMITALPIEVFAAECAAGELAVLPVDLDIRMDAFGIITRLHHPLSPSAEAVVTAVREAAALAYDAARR